MSHGVIDFLHLERVVLHDSAGNGMSRAQHYHSERTHLSNALAYFSRSLLAMSDIYDSSMRLNQWCRTYLRVLTLTLISWSLYFLPMFLNSDMSFSNVFSCACKELSSPPMCAY